VTTVDLNADLGESFGRWTLGDDEAMLDVVSSANVACGFHAGDPEIMAHTYRVAKKRGVAVGAHAGFPDLWGFGRRPIPFSAGEIERLVAYQIGAAVALASYAGHRITHVNAHGTLANLAETDKDVADAVARAISAVDRNLAALAIARSEQVRAGERAGLRVFSQIYADRAYTEAGTLVPRAEPGAVIHDADEAAARVVAMVEAGALITVSGAQLETPIDSVCVHGDSPHAIATARTVRRTLESVGAIVAPFGSS
jgi:5-oxoprolinase (ATP-hydrolysing) subunit A